MLLSSKENRASVLCGYSFFALNVCTYTMHKHIYSNLRTSPTSLRYWGWNSGSHAYEASTLPLSYSQFCESFLIFFPLLLSSGLKIDGQGTTDCKSCQKSSHVCALMGWQDRREKLRCGWGKWWWTVSARLGERVKTNLQAVLKKGLEEGRLDCKWLVW